MALSEISSQQSAPTENTMKRVNQFLDYMWTHPDAIIRYRASDMILNVHSDASYLSEPKARSRAGGYFFLGSSPRDGDPTKLNGAIHVTCTILKLVAASTAEHGYFEQPHTPGLWKHVSRPVWFNLCVDDFGIKYIETRLNYDNSQ